MQGASGNINALSKAKGLEKTFHFVQYTSKFGQKIYAWSLNLSCS